MGFCGVTTAQTRSFFLVEKSCKEMFLFFDTVILAKLTRCYWKFKLTLPFLHLLKQASYYIQPNTFEVQTLKS